ncbi:adaptive-response sensory-kinase [Corallococcus coralloides DSM 2259]|uniref:histidine kinase n=1 Tax=Corallococcus coralloides (strain ATCC 25202 / DSM 2259 / NBRC 100086 / M2) TaxID=1144275 RepID=H8MT54_CORCM|nr:HAMP domain-containing sensor histidine kinase [Corallococcus coralloides]AFE10300.1 adaptive-response sensory-kinase [Corallococcus coralloides DSM 2259]
MSFIEELKEHLQNVRSAQDGQPAPRLFVPEAKWVRAEFIRLVEHFEREPGQLSPERLIELHQEWSSDDRVVSYASNLAILLQEGFLHGEPRNVIEEHVLIGMMRRMGFSVRALSLTRLLEIDRLSTKAWHQVPRGTSRLNGPAKYALEIRAVRKQGDHQEVSPIGEVFLGLSGRDAIQWLLHVEAAQSIGPTDDWRLSRETAKQLLLTPEDVRTESGWDESALAHSWATLRRLGALGVLELVEEMMDPEGLISGYRLMNEGKRLLEALLAPSETPFSVLAATLSQDESLTALEKEGGGHPGLDTVFNSSAIATARQARLVVHEIRNALIPAQVALESLYNSVVGSQVEAEVARFRPRIDPGIDRALKFVTDLLKTSELAARAPEGFDVLRVLADAVASLATPLRIQLHVAPDLPSLSGYRERFVLAVVNLLRNAEQAGAHQVLIDCILEDNQRNLLLTVDDDGPGVRPEDRERIFQRGISLRPGGAGEGLALVKDIVAELRGKVACVDKPDGGARFRMRLPVAERTPR